MNNLVFSCVGLAVCQITKKLYVHTLSLINCHLKQLFAQAKIQYNLLLFLVMTILKDWEFFYLNASLSNLKPVYVQAQVVYT